MRTASRQGRLGTLKERNKTMLKRIIAIFGIALGISTATEPSLVPIISMGIGLLMLTSEVETWE